MAGISYCGRDPSRSAGPGPKVAGPMNIPRRSPPPGHSPGVVVALQPWRSLAVSTRHSRHSQAHLPKVVSSWVAFERDGASLGH